MKFNHIYYIEYFVYEDELVEIRCNMNLSFLSDICLKNWELKLKKE